MHFDTDLPLVCPILAKNNTRIASPFFRHKDVFPKIVSTLRTTRLPAP